MLQEVKETNKLLSELITCVKKNDRRIQKLEETLEATSSGNSTSPQRYQSRKKSVPLAVRVSYRILQIIL